MPKPSTNVPASPESTSAPTREAAAPVPDIDASQASMTAKREAAPVWPVEQPLLTRLTWPLWRAFIGTVFRVLGNGGLVVEGKENVPATGPVLLCPNHVGQADPAAVALALHYCHPSHPRRAYYMAKAELFDRRFLGTLLRNNFTFPVERGTADRRALRHTQALLQQGQAVVIFPEGGGNHENTLQPLHAGATLMALRLNIPIVPVALFGTYGIWPHGTGRLRRTKTPVRVWFGPPLDLSDLYGGGGESGAGNATGRKTTSKAAIATERLAHVLAEMLNQPVPNPPVV